MKPLTLMTFGCAAIFVSSLGFGFSGINSLSETSLREGQSDEVRQASFVAVPNFAVSNIAVPKYRSVKIENVPHIRQKPDYCGEACLEMVLRKLGKKIDQDMVFNQSGLDPAKGRGCYTRELVRAIRKLGFKLSSSGAVIDANQAKAQLEAQWRVMHSDLLAGYPTIVCMHYDDHPKTTEHFRLILGYDAATDEVIYHEPAETQGGYKKMKRSLLLKLWPLKYKKDQWTLIRMPLIAKKIRVPKAATVHDDSAYSQHIMKLKKKMPGKDFNLLIERPFVVVSDLPPRDLKRWTEGTVRWAVNRLKQDYFADDPDHIIDVWLFKDKNSYEKYTKEIFNDTPSTPYGYYSYRHRSLMMNISTGGGTLVHEIVHPLMATNFEKCPSWFNEGLASLYEQCRDQTETRRGKRVRRIWGNTNWRLAGLQRAIRAGGLPSFETLCGTTSDEFYSGDHEVTNYAQARYLCFYLQEQGKLIEFYHAFRKNAKQDPGGYETLKKIVGETDMNAFQKKWERYATKLRYP